MKKISIIGCGLIGGSFAALVKKFSPSTEVIGFGRRKEPLELAKENNIIDGFELTINPNTLSSSDAIIISSPIATVLPIIDELTKTISKPKTIIEFSSVKSFLNNDIVREITSQYYWNAPHGRPGCSRVGTRIILST